MQIYWFSSPATPQLNRCYGVTAHNQDDAMSLLHAAGFVDHRSEAMTIAIITDPAQLDQKHVLPNSGPLEVRGLWFPSLNVGRYQ